MNKVSAHSLQLQKGNTPIVALTCYDYSTARLIDEVVDLVLVGDSLGMVIQGNETTLSVTLEEMIYHTKAVKKGLKRAHLVSDMPFMTYQVSEEEALRNAGRLISEGGAEAVKLEGGVTMAATIAKIVSAGIPVLGHIGLTPQSVHAFGGYKIQGKTAEQKESILQDAIALEDAGAYAIVLEAVPEDLGKMVTERVKIPTIGIGAGIHCDGQILVIQDLLGMNESFKPKFVKQYTNLSAALRQSVSQYAEEVKAKSFPAAEHSFRTTS